MMGQRAFTKTFGALVAGAVTLAMTGCMDGEKMIYKSTPNQPTTVTIRNWTTGEDLWTYDIPVGQQLVLRFLNRESRTNELGYDEMSWVVVPIGTNPPAAKSTMKVPPPNARRIQMSIRPAGELPPEAMKSMGTGAPKAQPTAVPSGIVMPDPKQPAPK